jgi:putative DNA primase/helicase
MSAAERDAHRTRIAGMKEQRDAKLIQRNEAAAVQATQRLAAAAPCTQHAYTTTKGVQCHGLKVDAAGALIVPMRDTMGNLHSLQTITPDGDKRFMSGGRVKGCYHAIGKPAGLLIVCEGYATGASIHESTGHAVAVAFNAGNLEAVAVALHSKYPALKIIMAADDDYLTTGNPGMTKAKAAAQAVGGLVAVPIFPAGRSDKHTDLNDLHQLAGAGAVKDCIEAAALCGTAKDSADDWPELQSLIVQIDPQDYPTDALPKLIRGAVMEVCGFVKAPVPLVAMSALAALSVAIQAHTDVQRAIKLEGPCGLFLCGIADSGERKTSCDGYFTKAIHDYQAREHEKAKPLIQAYETDLDVWKSKRSGIQEKIKLLAKDNQPTNLLENQLHDLDKDKPRPPRVPRLIYSDATPEALALALVKDWPSGGVFSNEGGIVLGGHAMNKDVAMRNMGRLNSFWDGKIPATDRATSESYGDTTARLTMSLLVQEPTLRAFFANTKGLARGTGFLARFLVAWPESTMGTRMFSPPPDNWPALAAFSARLTAILDRPAPVNDIGVLTPAMLTLAPEAKQAWIDFHNQIETMLGTGGELYDLRDVGSKAADNVVRLAALFHVFAGSIGPIDFDCVESAVQIVTWHLTEAKRFLGELAMPPEVANPMRLETWMLDWCRREKTDSVPTREVQRVGPGGLRYKAALNEAIKELTELGRAREVQDGKKRLIQIRPELLVVKL